MGARPPGHIPPLPRAELHRGRALVAAASDHRDTVDDELSTVRRAFERLGAAPPRDRARHLLDSAAGDQAEQDAGVPNASARSSAQGQLGAPLC
jgi:hypothetical protein